MICGCGKIVEKAREELGFKICKACAFAMPDRPKVKGRMVYGHKTAGTIEILSAESWEANKKYLAEATARQLDYDRYETDKLLEDMKSSDYVNLIKLFDKHFGYYFTLYTKNEELLSDDK
jgi:hypothetical protein